MGGGITTSLLPTLNERMSDDMVNDGYSEDLKFGAKKRSGYSLLLSEGGGDGGSGTSLVSTVSSKDLITLEEEADEEENEDVNDER
jgi:hypothetical protein